MTKREILMLLLVGVLVYFNWQSANNYKQLQNQISNVQGNISHLQSQISNELRGVAHTLEQQRINERWWSPVNFEVEDISGDKATVKLSWQVREYGIGDKIGFNYRLGNSQEFVSAPVTEDAPGFFVSRVEVNLPDEPIIEVRTITHTRSEAPSRTNAAREIAAEWVSSDRANLNLQYYLVKETQGKLATSDHMSIDLSKLQYQMYLPIYGHVNIINHRNGYTIDSFLNEGGYHMSPPESKVISASLVARNNLGQTLASWDYRIEPGPGHRDLILDVQTDEIQKLYLIIKYSNGKVAERKLSGF